MHQPVDDEPPEQRLRRAVEIAIAELELTWFKIPCTETAFHEIAVRTARILGIETGAVKVGFLPQSYRFGHCPVLRVQGLGVEIVR